MPDHEGSLSKAERDLFAEHLNRWIDTHGPIACPVCKGMKWSIVPYVLTPLRVGGGGTVHGTGVVYPTLATVCDQCSYIMSFMADSVGIKFDV